MTEKKPQPKAKKIFSTKIIEKILPNLRKDMPIKTQERYRTPDRLYKKRNPSRHIIIKILNAQHKAKIGENRQKKLMKAILLE